MRSLADHVLDIAQNSVFAHSEHVKIEFFEDDEIVKFKIQDDGDGMDRTVFVNIFDPFFTTKNKEKKFGLGLPFLKQNAELTGGYVKVKSKRGVGTSVEAKFIKNIDCPPIGDLAGTFATLVTSSDKVKWNIKRCIKEACYVFSSEILKGVDITSVPVMKKIFEFFKENEIELSKESGGVKDAYDS